MNNISSTQPQIEQHSIGKSVILHLIPAVIGLIFYIPLARIATENGIPTMLVMYTVGIFVIFPFLIGYLFYQGKKKNGSLSLKGIVLFRKKMPWWQLITFGVFIVLWLMIVISVSSPTVAFLKKNLFFWIPGWFYLSKGSAAQNTFTVEIIMAVFGIVVIGVIGPIVEELYFRGFLLPRLSKLGGWAPLVNTILFFLYHFFQPHYLVVGTIGVLPWIYIVWWKRNIYLSIGVHCFINLFGNIIEVFQRF